jgi:hypothetical protein
MQKCEIFQGSKNGLGDWGGQGLSLVTGVCQRVPGKALPPWNRWRREGV